MNRDYFAKPIQSSRNGTGYGHTHLEDDQGPPGSGFAVAVPIGVLFWAVIIIAWLT